MKKNMRKRIHMYITEKRKEKKNLHIFIILSIYNSSIEALFSITYIRFLDTECEPFKQAHRCHSVLLIDMYSLHERILLLLVLERAFTFVSRDN